MNREEIVEVLNGKDTKENYVKAKALLLTCAESNQYYGFFDEYLASLKVPKASTRLRGFMLIMENAKWDDQNLMNQNLMNQNLEAILTLLEDEKPIIVRQAVQALTPIGSYKKELIPRGLEKLSSLNCLQYSENMQGLVKKDIEQMLHDLSGKTAD